MSKMNKFQAFRERNRKSNGYLLRKVSFNVAYKLCVLYCCLDCVS